MVLVTAVSEEEGGAGRGGAGVHGLNSQTNNYNYQLHKPAKCKSDNEKTP